MKPEPFREMVELDFREVLREESGGKQGDEHAPRHFAFRSFNVMLLTTCLTPFTFLATLVGLFLLLVGFDRPGQRDDALLD